MFSSKQLDGDYVATGHYRVWSAVGGSESAAPEYWQSTWLPDLRHLMFLGPVGSAAIGFRLALNSAGDLTGLFGTVPDSKQRSTTTYPLMFATAVQWLTMPNGQQAKLLANNGDYDAVVVSEDPGWSFSFRRRNHNQPNAINHIVFTLSPDQRSLPWKHLRLQLHATAALGGLDLVVTLDRLARS